MQMLVKSCKITTELIDKQQLTPLSVKEKLQLQTHKAMCKTCNAYEKQSKIIDSLINRWFRFSETNKTEKLSPEKKNAIIDQIKKV
ncbi:hypothetical protein SLW70_16025 [Flavobacterium sp. NG2]|uniref:hypothetical protein n=1 Tax=Flavobacterium sp. NG2 TaxID=3097547 RepID=UPI002A824F35|nr:hypothetical protein [Flavobacterium sp. NG2]WPR71423.1 hypothetical protein SLW70_16025 [Flavobacterium sp. NG2]